MIKNIEHSEKCKTPGKTTTTTSCSDCITCSHGFHQPSAFCSRGFRGGFHHPVWLATSVFHDRIWPAKYFATVCICPSLRSSCHGLSPPPSFFPPSLFLFLPSLPTLFPAPPSPRHPFTFPPPSPPFSVLPAPSFSTLPGRGEWGR